MTTTRFIRLPLAAAVLLAFSHTHAQTQTPLQTITVTGRVLPVEPAPAIGGFGAQPLARSPFSGTVISAEQLDDLSARQLSSLTRMDASVNDAYNATGYWSNLAVRGYVVDNRFNYRRDGLPINAETAFSLDNKSAVEVFKGTSGIQAGTSAPGGLVNLVVKRPEGRLRNATVGFTEGGSSRVAVDLGDRFGTDGAFGLRVNASYDDLDTQISNTQGHRSLAAVAADWRVTPGTLVEVEFESSRQTQPSVAGFSMLGDRVPDADDLDLLLNLNDQAWNKPVVMNGNTASLRITQQLGAGWSASAHGMVQRLKTDDYTAFPFGLFDANYECTWCDRYGPDGSFSYWQYVSENERRDTDALDLSLSGKLSTGGISHSLQTGLLLTRYKARFEDQIFDLAGTGSVDEIIEGPPSFGFMDANTNRDERSSELYVRDAMQLTERLGLWAGLRHTRVERQSERTSVDSDGSLRAIDYDQSATIPWLALAFQWSPSTLVYGSWGEGLESDVAPNRSRYTNAGAALPALKSRQIELGLKYQGDPFDATLAVFDIDRPQSADIGSCDADDSCTRVSDGTAHHRGVEGSLALRSGAWLWQASAMWLDAEREGSRDAAVNGLRPVNVPESSVRLNAAYNVAALPGLTLNAALAHEGSRMVLPDNSATIPSWQRLDIGARWRQQLAGARVTWRAGIDNVTDEKAWKESPYQFSHVYLYPLEPRTWRVSAQFEL